MMWMMALARSQNNFARAHARKNKTRALQSRFHDLPLDRRAPERNLTHYCDCGAASEQLWKTGDDHGRG
jgi:hypothetical protein